MNSKNKQYGIGWLRFYVNWRFPTYTHLFESIVVAFYQLINAAHVVGICVFNSISENVPEIINIMFSTTITKIVKSSFLGVNSYNRGHRSAICWPVFDYSGGKNTMEKYLETLGIKGHFRDRVYATLRIGIEIAQANVNSQGG